MDIPCSFQIGHVLMQWRLMRQTLCGSLLHVFLVYPGRRVLEECWGMTDKKADWMKMTWK